MGIYIEQRDKYQGPSKLDERLEAYRDPDSGHRILTQGDAARELLKSLLAFYRDKVGDSPLPPELFPPQRTSSKIEALVQIFEGSVPASKEGPLYDFDLIKEGIDLKRQEQSRRELEEERMRSEVLSRAGGRESESPQPEI